MDVLKEKSKEIETYDKSISEMKEELFKLTEENKAIKEINIMSNDQKDYEIRRLKEANDRLNQQLALQEQENRLLRKDASQHKGVLINFEHEYLHQKEIAGQMVKENKYLRETIDRLRRKYNDKSLTVNNSGKKERNTIYSSIPSQVYKFEKQ